MNPKHRNYIVIFFETDYIYFKDKILKIIETTLNKNPKINDTILNLYDNETEGFGCFQLELNNLLK